MRLIVITQYREDYNFDTDLPPRWKNKGGDEYLIANISLSDFIVGGSKMLQALVDKSRGLIEWENPASTNLIVDFELLQDGEMTYWEDISDGEIEVKDLTAEMAQLNYVEERRHAA
jgi:hypothetical protein